MKQLLLDLQADAPPTLENFVVADNAEIIASLRALTGSAGSAELPAPHLYLWGARGSGRSHLLQASVSAIRAGGHPARYLAAAAVEQAVPEEVGAVLAIDDVDQLSAAAQVALFNAFNRSRTLQQTLLLSGPLPPRALELREDLRTRIGQCLVYELQGLDDASRAAILHRWAQRRGLRLSDEVIDYLLRHGRRELPCLLHVLGELEHAALERQRPITLPLLRELMQRGLEL